MDIDPVEVGALAASDQLGKMADAEAAEFARYYRTLVDGGVPPPLAEALTRRHQSYRYGWGPAAEVED